MLVAPEWLERLALVTAGFVACFGVASVFLIEPT